MGVGPTIAIAEGRKEAPSRRTGKRRAGDSEVVVFAGLGTIL